MKRRLLWTAAVLLAAAGYLFENNAGTLTVLVGVLVVPICGLLPLMGKGAVLAVSLNTAQEKGTNATGTLTVTNRSVLPKPRLCVTVSCRNLRTGEAVESELELSLLSRQKKQIEFSLDCPHCGKVELSVTAVKLSDVFGLFDRRLPCEERKSFTVLPRLFEPSVSLEHSDMAMPDSDTYSAHKPGSDPGETFAMREYVPGDAVRSIHWKLSEKTDKTMVRQFGLPVVNEVALLLETAGAASADETDAITEVFASISAALASRDIQHHIFWRDTKTDELREYCVTGEEDFGVMLEELLELPPKESGSVAQRFLENYPHCPYSHVVIVGTQIPASVRDLYNGNRVSILIPSRDGIPEGLQGDGTHVLSFGTHSYAVDLGRMEV